MIPLKGRRVSPLSAAIVVLAVVAVVVTVVFLRSWHLVGAPSEVTPTLIVRTSATPTPAASPTNRTHTPEPTPTPNPTSVDLNVPFFSQAPSGDWSEPWQNACEEASSVLVHAYLSGEHLTQSSMEQGILQLVSWENSTFGYYQDTTAAQVGRMLREVYGYQHVDVRYDVGINVIVAELNAGRPVIVPLAGQLLGNPYYTPPGPVYHMLVVKGVTSDGKLITDDVGTKHGHNLTYDPAVFLNAMHDLPAGGASIPTDVDQEAWMLTGPRAMVVVYPN